MELPVNKLVVAAIAIAAVVLPAHAAAESVVPPENSAATQYTEAIPTGGGQKNAGSGDGKKRSPSSVLGKKKAKKLDAQGPQGHAAAQIAAETAPTTVPAQSEVAPEPAPAPSEPTPPPAHHESSHSSHQGDAGQQTGKAHAHSGTNVQDTELQPVAQQSTLDTSGGSSGLGEVLGQATGASSDGELGLLLPLLVLATLVWALVYAMRRKRPAA